MKTILSIACFAAVALTVALVVQRQAAVKETELVRKLQLQAEKSDLGEKKAKAQIEDLEKEVLKLRGEVRAAEVDLASARNAPGTSNSTAVSGVRTAGQSAPAPGVGDQPGNMGNILAKMMKNPEMKKAMEQQQRMATDMIYGSLMKKLQLTPDQEKQFRELLLEQQMGNVSQAGAMFENATNRVEMAEKMMESRQAREEQIKALLGDEKFEQYQDYNQTLGERMMLDQFAKQSDISPDQTDQILAIMREEKKNVQMNQGIGPSDPAQDWQKALDGEMAERLFEQQEQVNARVLQRAGQVLTPEQLEKLGPTLKSQLEMQRAGMKMAREMFGGEAKPAP